MSNTEKGKKSTNRKFHLEYKNAKQKLAWAIFEQHDVLFLSGPAGTGKTFLSMAFAITEVLMKRKKKIVLTRPIVESGESLGFLPGDVYEKVNPYMRPLFDAMQDLVHNESQKREVESSVRVSPIAYMRGTTFKDSICIFDEAQNATYGQLKLFLSRFGENSKIIITGDPKQSDISNRDSAFSSVMSKLEKVPGIGVVKFDSSDIVRHPLVSMILEKLEE